MEHTELARMGGYGRAAALTPEQRKRAARKAVRARWLKYYREHPDKRRGRTRRKAA